MLKSLAILGLSIGLVNAVWLQVPRNGGHQDEKTQQDQNQASMPQLVSPPRIHTQQTTSDQKQDSNTESSGYQWHELLAPANIPNWCLMLVGIWAGGMAYWTLRNIEKQTDQLKVQATLMRGQMDMMIHKDRARLHIDPQALQLVNGEGGFWYLTTGIELTNVGQSKAYITFSAGRFVVIPIGRPPLPEPYPEDLWPIPSVVEASGEPVYAALFFEDSPLNFKELTDKLANRDFTARLYGFVEYESLGIKRHRDFGYVWTIDESVRNSASESSEELIRAGWWEQDLNQKNVDFEMKAN